MWIIGNLNRAPAWPILQGKGATEAVEGWNGMGLAERRRGWRRLLGWRSLLGWRRFFGWRSPGWRRLFGATAFKLAIAYFVIVGLGFTLVMEQVGENVRQLMTTRRSQTIDAEIKGLAEQYKAGGLTQLVAMVQRRSRTPGNSIYLVAAPNGVTVAGNVLQLPAGVLDQKNARWRSSMNASANPMSNATPWPGFSPCREISAC